MFKPRGIPTITEADITRFWSRVEIKGANECWKFKGLRGTNKKYGTFNLNYGKSALKLSLRANRMAWFLSNHRQPGNFLICHKCDNPSCCNPAHLFLGTYKDNNNDAMRKGRQFRVDNNGEKNGMAKLNKGIVLEIRRLHELGYRNKDISTRLKVRDNNISRIIRYQRWASI